MNLQRGPGQTGVVPIDPATGKPYTNAVLTGSPNPVTNTFNPGVGIAQDQAQQGAQQSLQQQAQQKQAAAAAQQAAAAQEAARQAALRPVTDPTTGVMSTLDPNTAMIHAATARSLQLLRGTGQQGVQQGMQGLRQNLAQRGLMDSGSLGAGASRISNNYGNLMAQGTMNAANNETDKILGLQQSEAERQQQIKMAGINDAYQRSLLELQARLQRENQPTGWQQFAGGLAQGAGAAIPAFLGGL